jgi:D-arabinose 1-dehydrogenase-like Zn-dependent alcohol dehydrogenase
MRAAVLEQFGQPLAVQELELDEPPAGEVLVRLETCGVCHTDMYTASGADPSGYAPAVLGHEGAGIVGHFSTAACPDAARREGRGGADGLGAVHDRRGCRKGRDARHRAAPATGP